MNPFWAICFVCFRGLYESLLGYSFSDALGTFANPFWALCFPCFGVFVNPFWAIRSPLLLEVWLCVFLSFWRV